MPPFLDLAQISLCQGQCILLGRICMDQESFWDHVKLLPDVQRSEFWLEYHSLLFWYQQLCSAWLLALRCCLVSEFHEWRPRCTESRCDLYIGEDGLFQTWCPTQLVLWSIKKHRKKTSKTYLQFLNAPTPNFSFFRLVLQGWCFMLTRALISLGWLLSKYCQISSLRCDEVNISTHIDVIKQLSLCWAFSRIKPIDKVLQGVNRSDSIDTSWIKDIEGISSINKVKS